MFNKGYLIGIIDTWTGSHQKFFPFSMGCVKCLELGKLEIRPINKSFVNIPKYEQEQKRYEKNTVHSWVYY